MVFVGRVQEGLALCNGKHGFHKLQIFWIENKSNMYGCCNLIFVRKLCIIEIYILTGMHPTFKHVPPKVPLTSTQVV